MPRTKYRCVEIGPHRLYRGDWRDVLPDLDAGIIDAVVSDPPYGIGYRHGGGGQVGLRRAIGARRIALGQASIWEEYCADHWR